MPAHEETEWKKRSSPCYSSVPCSPPRWRKSASTAVAAKTKKKTRRAPRAAGHGWGPPWPAPPAAGAAPSPATPRTGSSDQKARDADMRAILESELRKAEARHAE